jgi:hypothetical protein
MQLHRYFVSQSSEFCHHILCVASQQVIPKLRVYFVIDSDRKLLDVPSYVPKCSAFVKYLQILQLHLMIIKVIILHSLNAVSIKTVVETRHIPFFANRIRVPLTVAAWLDVRSTTLSLQSRHFNCCEVLYTEKQLERGKSSSSFVTWPSPYSCCNFSVADAERVRLNAEKQANLSCHGA